MASKDGKREKGEKKEARKVGKLVNECASGERELLRTLDITAG